MIDWLEAGLPSGAPAADWPFLRVKEFADCTACVKRLLPGSHASLPHQVE